MRNFDTAIFSSGLDSFKSVRDEMAVAGGPAGINIKVNRSMGSWGKRFVRVARAYMTKMEMTGKMPKRIRSTMVLGCHWMVPLCSPRFIFLRQLPSLTPTTTTWGGCDQQMLQLHFAKKSYLQCSKDFPHALDAGSQPCLEESTLLRIIKECSMQWWRQTNDSPHQGSYQRGVDETVEQVKDRLCFWPESVPDSLAFAITIFLCFGHSTNGVLREQRGFFCGLTIGMAVRLSILLSPLRAIWQILDLRLGFALSMIWI